MTSKCFPETDRCSHTLEIHKCSLHEGLGEPVCSAIFAVGGHDWRISYYPDGYYGKTSEGYAAVYLDFMSKGCHVGTRVRGYFDFGLVNAATGQYNIMFRSTSMLLKHIVLDDNVQHSWGTSKFVRSRELHVSPYMQRGGCLTIKCNVAIVTGSRLSSEHEAMREIPVPSSDLSTDLGKLLGAEEGADVTFKVKGEVFHAHKVVLATRSPVFKAELYGLVGNRKRRRITVEDIEPAVFKALLYFIYTDSLPAANDGLGEDDNEEIVEDLLVTADRYAMERMKLVCESVLSKRLDVENVADTSALADRHYCSKLKDACIRFIVSSRKRVKDVMASQGYEHLKKSCPSVVMDLLEQAAKSSVC